MAHRSRCRGFVVAVSACVAVAVACSGRWASAESAAEKKIRETLSKSTPLEFNETPLRDVIKYFTDVHSINIQLNQKKMEEANVTLDTPVTKVLKDVSFASSLNLLLRDLGLTYVIENDVLLVTSQESAHRDSTPRVYDIAGLGGATDRETLLKAVEMVLDRPENGPDGKPLPIASRLLIFRDKLVLRGSQPEQDRTAELLQRLREPPRAVTVEPK